jgi:acetyl/propionyl-CoA carboxylase alpha subunit
VIVGQTVKENDSLLILEAMKMENSFPRWNYQIDIVMQRCWDDKAALIEARK